MLYNNLFVVLHVTNSNINNQVVAVVFPFSKYNFKNIREKKGCCSKTTFKLFIGNKSGHINCFMSLRKY